MPNAKSLRAALEEMTEDDRRFLVQWCDAQLERGYIKQVSGKYIKDPIKEVKNEHSLNRTLLTRRIDTFGLRGRT
jgi:hypothetical protein